MAAHSCWLWISCLAFTVKVEIDEHGYVTDGAPIIRKFTGQTLDNLLRFARRRGELRFAVLSAETWV